MNFNRVFYLGLNLFLFLFFESFSQKTDILIHKVPLYLGISQGIGTSVFPELKTENKISINILSGHSYGNTGFLFSGISHFQSKTSKGIQISGISSVVGEPFEKRKNQEEFENNFSTLQFSGFFNLVHGQGFGSQITGGINSIKGNFDGIQIAGLYNEVGKSFSGFQAVGLINYIKKYGIGFQLSGLINSSSWFAGVQLSGLINVAKRELDGIQFSLFNFIGNKSSTIFRENKFYWMQVGLLNWSIKNADGFQIGLINRSKDVGFSQIGIINFSNKIPQYPIGLLNIASNAEVIVRSYYSSIFPVTLEIGTGSKKLMNIISYSFKNKDQFKSIGYGLGKIHQGGMKGRQYFLDYYLTVNQSFIKFKEIIKNKPIYGAKVQIGYNPFVRTKFDLFFFVSLVLQTQKKHPNSRIENVLYKFDTDGRKNWINLNFGIQL